MIIGSKVNQGYSWDRLPITNPKDYLPYAAATVTTHQFGTQSNTSAQDWATAAGYQVLNLKNLHCPISDITNNTRCLFDPKTTLKVMLFVKNNELLICFGAKNSFETETSVSERFRCNLRQWCQILGNFFGFVPSIYPLADQVVEHIRTLPDFTRHKITLAGHSFGGSIAQYVGLKQSIKTFIFNSAPIGSGLQTRIGKAKLLAARSWIRHLSINGDYLSHNRFLYYIDRCFSAIGIKTPGSFGRRETIPSSSSDLYGCHAFIMRSIGESYGIGNPTSGADFRAKLQTRPL